MSMLKISKETYKTIAQAIVNRWLESDPNYERIMSLMFNDTNPDRVVQNLIDDFVDTEMGTFFLGEMIWQMTPEIIKQMKAEYCSYLNDKNIALTGKSLEEWAGFESAFSP